MFHIIKLKHVLSCSPKICSEMNFSYEHFAELIFQSLGYFSPSKSEMTHICILPLVVVNKDPSQYGRRQTRTHYLSSNHSTERCKQRLTQSIVCNSQLLMNGTYMKNARLSVLKTGILYS